MAKALIREHDLRVMHMGPESDRHVRRLKVCFLEMAAVTVNLYFPRTIIDDLNTEQEEVMENLSILFGIAISADDDPSARTMACHALCACKSEPFLTYLLRSNRNTN